jgi:thiol-disulfide isomerase/thioredoxin
MTPFERVHMPAFAGATEWLNSEPLGPAELRGRVVVVNFWTFTCINWLRQAPHVRAWAEAYRDDGLVVIGVHTPEFAFEHDVDGVRLATNERGLGYPVAVDNGYEIWDAFANRYWPALYFTDRDGVIRDHHFGEGRYEQSEETIQRLLGVTRPLAVAGGIGPEAQADWPHLRTPETYLGYRRSNGFTSHDAGGYDERRTYRAPERLGLNRWAFDGEWTIRREHALVEGAGGSVLCRFHARDAHLVLSAAGRTPIPFRVQLDGEAPGASHGVDVDEAGDGRLREGRLYQLVRQRGAVRERTLRITFHERGAEAYAFTFG